MKSSLALFLLALPLGLSSAGEPVEVRLPKGALQPRVATTTDGTTQIVFLEGNPQACEVKLASLSPTSALSAPVTVSAPSTPAIAMGTVRGPSIAIGSEGVRQILWHGKNGSARGGKGSALYFARAEASGKISAPTDMLGTSTGLDGGAAIAANSRGEVWIVWHALPAGKEGETERRILVRHSADNGLTFSEPWTIKGEDMGVCGCCGLAAAADDAGKLYVLYRTAEQSKKRGARLLRLPPGATGETPPDLLTKDQWSLAACPMTTAAWLPSAEGAEAIWVNGFKLHTLGSALEHVDLSPFTANAMQNHPRVTRNAAGEMLWVWTEGAMWGKGGELVTQLFSVDGKPTGKPQKHPLPPWSYGARAALPDGRFAIIY